MSTKKKETALTEEPVEETVKEESQEADSLEAIIARAVAAALKAQKAESDAKIADLEKRLSEKEGKKTVAAPSGDVTLVYLSDSPGILNKVPGLTLRCGHYGEEFTLSRSQFDQIVGQYREWFNKGILAVSRDNVDVAAKKGLKTQDEYALKPEQLKRIGTMPIEELKKLWAACKTENERLCIIFYYKRKFIEGKEPGFREAERVLAMNSLTKQGFQREALEISGAPSKIGPRDFLSL